VESSCGYEEEVIAETSGCLISCTYDYPSGKETLSILPMRCDSPS